MTTTTTAPPTLMEQRATIGLKTPTWEAKKLIWSRVKSGTAQITNGYKPLYSAKKAHQANTRAIGVSGGWRAGKSLFSAMEGIAWLPYASLIWIIGKDYDMTRQEFIYLSEAAIATGLAIEPDVRLSLNKYSPSVMRAITGCIVETRTLADFRKLASKAPDLIIICEPGLIDNLQQVMELVWGRVAEKRGCIILAGTSDESSEEWFELYERWQMASPEGGKSFAIPTWQNIYKFPTGRNDPEFVTYGEIYGEEALLTHYGGIPASPRNLVLRGHWSPKVHVSEAAIWTPNLPTEITIDPNSAAPNAYTVECMQWNLETGDIFIVDEVAESGLNHDAVKAIVAEREWFKYVHGGTIDPFAEGNVYGNAVPATYWLPIPLRYNHRPKVASTVQALKEALAIRPVSGTSRMVVSPKCVRFQEEATKWRTDKYGKPAKLWCDAMKATGYWLYDKFAVERLDIDTSDESNEITASDWSFE